MELVISVIIVCAVLISAAILLSSVFRIPRCCVDGETLDRLDSAIDELNGAMKIKNTIPCAVVGCDGVLDDEAVCVKCGLPWTLAHGAQVKKEGQ